MMPRVRITARPIMLAWRFSQPIRTGDMDVRIVVIQSYRTAGVETWMQLCMRSVSQWAAHRGYDYEFVDDTLFDFLPPHIRNDTSAALLPKTDIARLGLLHDRLIDRYQRAVWIDADVLVFNPAAFSIPDTCGAMFCHEVWTSLTDQGELAHRPGINNALMIFERAHPLLDFLRYATVELYERGEPSSMSPTALGTTLLSRLGRIVPLRLHTQVACISPLLTHAAYNRDHPEWLHAHAQQHGHRFHAANLCRSLLISAQPLRQAPNRLDENQVHQLVEELLATHGALFIGNAARV
jgi:hypothetical protein